ncbi:TPA: hypothetical protein U8251_002862 [Pseudomonas putida]|nr:hypothetical protein [Pseudomonas putida]
MRKEIIQSVLCATPIVRVLEPLNSLSDTKLVKWHYPESDIYIKDLPILLNDDNSPWEDGTYFLMTRLFDSDFNRTSLNIKTVSRKADDLAFYMNALKELSIDYRADERFKMNRPTYAFTTYLADKISDGSLAAGSGARIIGTVVEFHRHRQLQYQSTNLFPLWEDIETSRKSYDNKGVPIFQTCYTTDLMRMTKKAHRSSAQDQHQHYVSDEGKLKPLTATQQKVVFEALYILQNPEMILSFLISTSTSARIQTTFTLRANSFKKKLDQRHDKVRIHTGRGTNVDTKKNKKHYIDIPAWLYTKLHMYVHSSRHLQRAANCKLPEDQKYLFYSSRGNPYITASNDIMNKSRDGSAIRVFLREKLLPQITTLGHDFTFKFHDLRATYCMNRIDEGLIWVEQGKTTLDAVMRATRDAMGHSSLETTQGYMDYRNLNPVITKTEQEWSNKLMNDIAASLGMIDELY